MTKLIHLFPDLLNLYGDRGNLAVLTHVLSKMGAEVTTECYYPGDELLLEDVALVYAGPGTEKNVERARAILQTEASKLKAAAEKGMPMLFLGSAAALACEEIATENDARPALGLVGAKATMTKTRQTGDVIYECSIWDNVLVGFINKSCYMTCVETPLFKSVFGPGGILTSDGEEIRAEGVLKNNVIASFVTGPMLVKNPWLRSIIAKNIFAFALPGIEPEEPSQNYWDKAYDITLEELKNRM